MGITGSNKKKSIKDAQVTVYDESENIIDQLQNYASEYNYGTTNSLRIEEGKAYKIKIDATGYPSIETKTSFPFFPNSTEFIHQSNSIITNQITLKLNLKDSSSGHKYYGIKVRVTKYKINQDSILGVKDTIYISSRYSKLTSSDIRATNTNQTNFGDWLLLKNDNLVFNNFIFQIQPENETIEVDYFYKADIILGALSYDSFLFNSTFQLYKKKLNNPFLDQPIRVYSNIENGLGVFAGQTIKDFRIEFIVN
jgi:hypothetical protein